MTSQEQNILLVEDSPTQALQLVDTFESEGWHVDWERTAEGALRKLGDSNPAALVVDSLLPGMRGEELCRRLRMNGGTQGIPILMLTADRTGQAEVEGLDSGADDFVAKSADSNVLVSRLRILLETSIRVPSLVTTPGARRGTSRLLSIDDSPTHQMFLANELAKEGYEIETVMSGADGLARLESKEFDCVLIDLVMPEMDGIEVCRRIRSRQDIGESRVTILMLTAQENRDQLMRALEAGADDFVGKSSELAVLKGRIRALLRRKSVEEEHRRIQKELKKKEVERINALAAQQVAEAKAALNDELERRIVERTGELAQANRELAQKQRENELFVYSVSHDLRSPLLNLQGFSGELQSVSCELRTLLADPARPEDWQDRAVAMLDESMAHSIRFIQTAVTRLSRIIDALLQLSRAGSVEYQRQVVDVQQVVERVVDSVQSVAKERKVTMRTLAMPNAWGDTTAIERVFGNLVDNAVKYLDPRRPPEIEIGSVGRRPPEANPDADYVTYYVRDNGLGIPKEASPKLFKAFQRLHPGVAEGEGIGLALVRRIVERQKGMIWFESHVGEGTTFFVALPKA